MHSADRCICGSGLFDGNPEPRVVFSQCIEAKGHNSGGLSCKVAFEGVWGTCGETEGLVILEQREGQRVGASHRAAAE